LEKYVIHDEDILEAFSCRKSQQLNPMTPNDHYSGRTAPLTSKRCILYIYSTNIGTEYFKRGIYSPFFSLQNAVCFIILTSLVPVLFIFYIQGELKLKNNSGAKRFKGVSVQFNGPISRVKQSKKTAGPQKDGADRL
jgi:hypothetical protein